MVRADIKFTAGTHRCIGGVGPNKESVPWLTQEDALKHIAFLQSKGYEVELVRFV